MRIFIRKTLKRFLDDNASAALKRLEFKTKTRLVQLAPEIDETALRNMLCDRLGVRIGQDVFIHASTSMIRTQLTPARMVEIVRDCIGPDAGIFAPAFPRMSSAQFLETRDYFDPGMEPSGMGALSEHIRNLPGSVRSNHPTKSIVGVGPGVAELLGGHERSYLSFDRGSPYFRLVERDALVIGLGAQPSYLTFVHVYEDCNPDLYPLRVYSKAPKEIEMLIDGERKRMRFATHDLGVVSKANPGRFMRRNLNPADFKILSWYLTPFFSVSSKALYDAIGNSLPETIYY